MTRKKRGDEERTLRLVEVVGDRDELRTGHVVRERLALVVIPVPRTRYPGLLERNDVVLRQVVSI